ncbi:MAG: dual specificity protein phosphatase family protein [Candidatus Saccharibacteria bacterium]|nr:dual specificity protein phosphatase family protein [Moraxellaceae bacterium]
MISKIICVSRTAAENTIGWDNWAVISINEPGNSNGEVKLQRGWYAISRVNFHDTDLSQLSDESHILLDNMHALEIVDFAHAVAPHVEGIMVHCKAGISRSPAVAKWIAETFIVPFNHNYGSYNKFVYNQLVAAAKVRSRRPNNG